MEDKGIAVIATLVILVFALIFFLGGYQTGHERGYTKGAEHSARYHEQTGEFPSQDWLRENRGRNFLELSP